MSVKHDNIIDALAAAQRAFPAIPKDKTNPHFKSQYASLDAIVSATRPALTENGIAVTQTFSDVGETAFVVTTLHHASGGALSSAVPVFSDHSMQSLGSAITYARRYGLAGLIGVCADEDDDGNAAGQQQPQAKPTKAPTKPKPEPATNGEPPSAEKLIAGASKLYGECQNCDELLAALDRVAAGREKFANNADFTKAINAVLNYTQPLSDEEVLHINRKASFLIARQPGVMTAAELEMEAEAAFNN